MKHKFVVEKLAHELCTIPSVSGDEATLVTLLEQLFLTQGLVVRRQVISEGGGRDNLFVCSPRNLSPQIILSTHVDTVPPYFAPSQKDGWLYARGACDAKGIAAAMICALDELLSANEHRVGLLLVVGEETTSDGAKKVSDGFMPSVDYIINGEPTDLKLVSAMKGVLAFHLVTKGETGHSAYPEAGRSAVHQLCKDLAALLAEDWPFHEQFGATTLNIGTIEGGRSANVIADHARAACMMRVTTDPDHMLTRIAELVDKNTEIEIKSKSPPQILHTVAGYESCIVSFGSDIPFLRKLGTPLLIGPGSILDAHTSQDRVLIEDLKRAVIIYRDLALKLLSSP